MSDKPLRELSGELTQRRQIFYDEIDTHAMAPLWEVMAALVPREPVTPCLPYHWAWPMVRERLLQAGELITAEEAERRVLVLENPGLRGQSSVTHSLYAGVQMILPGEIAPDHRHTATAIRLIMEGKGGFTAVDGERAGMERGDFIITPSWTWHGHGNEGDGPMFWLDGLDVPLVRLLDAGFSDPHRHEPAESPRPEVSPQLFSGHLLPVDYQSSRSNPVFRYPYERTRAILQRLSLSQALDDVHGIKLRYAHPGTGGWATATMGACVQWMPRGFESQLYRSTDATVFCVIEGEGSSNVGEQRIEWHPNDVFVVPSWMPVTHHAAQDAVLFSMSDRPTQQALNVWREARG